MEEFGVLSLLLTLSSFLIYLFTLGSFQFVFKNIAGNTIELHKAPFWAALLVTLIGSLIPMTVTVVWLHEISNLFNLLSFERELALTISATGLTSVMIIFLFYHYGLSRNNFQNLLQFLRGSLWVILSVAGSFFFDLTLLNVMLIINAALIIIIVISFPWKEIKLLAPVELSKSTFSRLFRYCIPLLPYFAGAWGIPLIVRMQLNIIEGAKNVAIFSVAYTLMEIVFMFISTITATISPYFFAESENNAKPWLYYNIMLKYSLISIVLIVPAIILLRYDIIHFAATDKYLIAGDYIPILVLFPLLRVLIIVFEQYFLKTSRTVYLGTVYIIGILLSFLLSVILIPHYSITGAISASLISYAVIFICLYVRQRDTIDFSYLSFPAIIKLTLIVTGCLVVLNFFHFSNIYKVLILGSLTLFSLNALPILNEQERNKILNILRLKK